MTSPDHSVDHPENHADDNAVTSIYRTALQASEVKISGLDDAALNNVMRDLLQAQAYLAGAEPVIVNTEVKAKDDGCDGWSSAPRSPDRWLGNSATCWQFKAGVAGQPAPAARRD